MKDIAGVERVNKVLAMTGVVGTGADIHPAELVPLRAHVSGRPLEPKFHPRRTGWPHSLEGIMSSGVTSTGEAGTLTTADRKIVSTQRRNSMAIWGRLRGEQGRY